MAEDKVLVGDNPNIEEDDGRCSHRYWFVSSDLCARMKDDFLIDNGSEAIRQSQELLAKHYTGATPPPDPVTGQIWLNNSNPNCPTMHVYTGNAWVGVPAPQDKSLKACKRRFPEPPPLSLPSDTPPPTPWPYNAAAIAERLAKGSVPPTPVDEEQVRKERIWKAIKESSRM